MNDPLTSRPDTGAPGGMTGFANPSASVTLSTQNGSAVTAMRSDAAPAISQAISPIWTGAHVWSRSGVGTTWSHRMSMQSSSPGSVGVSNDSPAFQQIANVWDATASASSTAQSAFKTVGHETAGRPDVTWQLRTVVDNGGGTRHSLAVRQNFGLRADVFACDRDGGASTTDTTGFLYIPAVAGAPTGVPANTGTNIVPIQYDTTNNKLYVYNGGWKSVTLA